MTQVSRKENTLRKINSARTLLVGALMTALASTPLAAQEQKTVSVNGVKLEYSDTGQGDPIVFLHGAFSDLSVWDGYEALLGEDKRFIALTMRYFGKSEWPDKGEAFAVNVFVDDLIGFIEELDVGPVHLVTRSFGGAIGTYAILKRPDLFKSAVHNEPFHTPMMAGMPGVNAALDEMFKDVGPSIVAMQNGKFEEATLGIMEIIYREPAGSAADWDAKTIAMMKDNARTLAPFFTMAEGAELRCEDYAAIDVPTLVVQGSTTHVGFSMLSEQVAKCQSNALLVTLPGVGHEAPSTEKETFARLINNFTDLVALETPQ